MVDKDLLFIGCKSVTVSGIELYEYTIREILEYGKADFNRLVYFSAIKPIDLFERKTVTKKQMENVDVFDLIPVFDTKTLKWCTDMLNLVTKKDGWVFNHNTNNFQCVVIDGDDIEVLRINRSNFKDIMDSIALMFAVQRNDPYEKYEYYDNSDDFVKEVIDEEVQKELEEQKNSKSKVTISSVIEAVACHRDSGVNANTVGDLNMYQLFRILARIQQKNIYDNNMRAIYSGNIADVKKINFDDISWLKNLDNK